MTDPQIPPPPPPPSTANINVGTLSIAEREALAAEIKRQRKDERSGKMRQTLGRITPRHWSSLGAIVSVAVLAVGCNEYADMRAADRRSEERQTEFLAAVLNPTATSQPPAGSSPSGMDNPLELMPLTEQARWSIGLGSTKREDGEFALQPGRSALVVSQMLDLVNPCELWISVDNKRQPVVSREQSPGAVPMAVCRPTTTTTAVPAQ